MMKKVECFTSSSERCVSTKINAWLDKRPGFKLIDVKYQVYIDNCNEVTDAALLIYDDGENDEN